MSQLVDRMIRAAKLDVNLYEEVEADTTATRQALLVVLIYSICAGIGSGLVNVWNENVGHFFWSLFVGLISALVFWLMWSLITYFIGTRLFRGPETSATYGELLRTIGFSAAPGVLMIFAFVPFVGGFISFLVWVWMLVAMVIAVRQALDFTTWRAIGTVVVGGIIYLVIIIIIGLIVGLGIYGVS
ncbi:MAG: YIP1 family protein [Dehalococcoidia bacterium]|nr:YIP1 family protein [Dehalococcoidia bacterium]